MDSCRGVGCYTGTTKVRVIRKEYSKMSKIISWVLANGATLLGCIQAVIKAIKELLTGIVNLLSLFMPAATAEKAVAAVRAAMNFIDSLIEKLKGYLIK